MIIKMNKRFKVPVILSWWKFIATCKQMSYKTHVKLFKLHLSYGFIKYFIKYLKLELHPRNMLQKIPLVQILSQ